MARYKITSVGNRVILFCVDIFMIVELVWHTRGLLLHRDVGYWELTSEV